MSNLSQRFNNLSLYKKILLILSTTLLFVFFAFVVSIQLLSQYYARELYTSNAQSLNYVSSFVSARMETVESGSARILSDTIIQTNLTDIMDAPTSIRNAQRKQTIYQALYPYIFDDDYIKSISLILPDDTMICMGNTSDLDAFPLEELAENAHGGFEIEVEDGVYYVNAMWLEPILRTVNMEDYSSLQYFQRVLRSSGIIDALEEKGIQEGDTVDILGFEFDFVP